MVLLFLTVKFLVIIVLVVCGYNNRRLRPHLIRFWTFMARHNFQRIFGGLIISWETSDPEDPPAIPLAEILNNSGRSNAPARPNSLGPFPEREIGPSTSNPSVPVPPDPLPSYTQELTAEEELRRLLGPEQSNPNGVYNKPTVAVKNYPDYNFSYPFFEIKKFVIFRLVLPSTHRSEQWLRTTTFLWRKAWFLGSIFRRFTSTNLQVAKTFFRIF